MAALRLAMAPPGSVAALRLAMAPSAICRSSQFAEKYQTLLQISVDYMTTGDARIRRVVARLTTIERTIISALRTAGRWMKRKVSSRVSTNCAEHHPDA